MTSPGPRTPLQAPELDPSIDHSPGCITCGDLAGRMRVLAVDAPRELALCVDAQGRHHRVDTGIAGPVAPDDILLVHAGAALLREPG